MKLKITERKIKFGSNILLSAIKKKMTNEQFEMVFATNYFGPFLLTHLLLGKFIFLYLKNIFYFYIQNLL